MVGKPTNAFSTFERYIVKRKKNLFFAILAMLLIIMSTTVVSAQSSFIDKFHHNFIADQRWKYLTNGLLITLEISIVAVLIGIVGGFLIAILRSTFDTIEKKNIFTKTINWILKAYITVIRGTPAVIQLMIIYFVVFATTNVDKVTAAFISFGINSSAYIAEIVRSGIMSVDPGQFEAGRSLGFSHAGTMWHFILPQAFKNILPALGNEFIVLVKETSIAGYIGIVDLTKGGDIIRSRTYEAFLPLIAVALIYLVIVMFLTMLVGKLERRLKTDGK